MTETQTKAIVCVDDEAIILMSLKAQLRNTYRDKYIIETSLSGEEAIVIVDELVSSGVKVVILISDWHMPKMKGDELLKIISQKYPDIHLLLVTGQADKLIVDSLRASIQKLEVIYKPWDRSTLIRYIDQIESRN